MKFTFSCRGDLKTTCLGLLNAATSLCFLLIVVAMPKGVSQSTGTHLARPPLLLLMAVTQVSPVSPSRVSFFGGGNWTLSLDIVGAPLLGTEGLFSVELGSFREWGKDWDFVWGGGY